MLDENDEPNNHYDGKAPIYIENWLEYHHCGFGTISAQTFARLYGADGIGVHRCL